MCHVSYFGLKSRYQLSYDSFLNMGCNTGMVNVAMLHPQVRTRDLRWMLTGFHHAGPDLWKKKMGPRHLHPGKCKLARSSAHSLGVAVERGGAAGQIDRTQWRSPAEIWQPLLRQGAVTRSLMWDPATAGSSPQSARGEQKLAEPQLDILTPEVKFQHMKCLAIKFWTYSSMFPTSLLADGKAECLSPKRRWGLKFFVNGT